MLFRKTSLSEMVSFPKDRIDIYKCCDFCDPVIYRGACGAGLQPRPGLCALIVSFLPFPGEQDGLGPPQEEVWAVQGGYTAGAAHPEAEFSAHVET